MYIFSPDNDIEFKRLEAAGYSGSINDMQKQFLSNLGYSGSLGDMIGVRNKQIADIKSLNPIVWVDPTISKNLVLRAGTGAESESTDSVGFIENLGSAADNLIANNDGEEPTLDFTGGVPSYNFDGSDDRMTINFDGAVGPVDCAISIALKTSDANAILVGNNAVGGNKYCIVIANGSGSGGRGNGIGVNTDLYANDVLIDPFTRDDVHTALSIGDWIISEARNVKMDTWTEAGLSNYGVGFRLDGNVAAFLITPMDTYDKDKVLAYMYSAVGI
jgi:hypothetical protein